MDWIDVTLTISEELQHFPKEMESFRHTYLTEIGKAGCISNSSAFCTNSHFGTHVDAPFHFINGGKKLDELGLELFIGDCLVVEAKDENGIIYIEHLEKIVPYDTRRIIIKTQNSTKFCETNFNYDYVSLDTQAIKWLVQMGVRLLGGDFPTLGREFVKAHQALFEAGETAAVESLYLSEVESGRYYVICLPLKIKDAEASPARVILGRA